MDDNRWPHIKRYLANRPRQGFIDWNLETQDVELPNAEVAAASEEWADWFGWSFDQAAAELADDRAKRHRLEEWTASMVYCCDRLAAWARGDDPGEWVPMSVRRPDIHAEGQAIVADIIARIDRPAENHAVS